MQHGRKISKVFPIHKLLSVISRWGEMIAQSLSLFCAFSHVYTNCDTRICVHKKPSTYYIFSSLQQDPPSSLFMKYVWLKERLNESTILCHSQFSYKKQNGQERTFLSLFQIPYRRHQLLLLALALLALSSAVSARGIRRRQQKQEDKDEEQANPQKTIFTCGGSRQVK